MSILEPRLNFSFDKISQTNFLISNTVQKLTRNKLTLVKAKSRNYCIVLSSCNKVSSFRPFLSDMVQFTFWSSTSLRISKMSSF